MLILSLSQSAAKSTTVDRRRRINSKPGCILASGGQQSLRDRAPCPPEANHRKLAGPLDYNDCFKRNRRRSTARRRESTTLSLETTWWLRQSCRRPTEKRKSWVASE